MGDEKAETGKSRADHLEDPVNDRQQVGEFRVTNTREIVL